MAKTIETAVPETVNEPKEVKELTYDEIVDNLFADEKTTKFKGLTIMKISYSEREDGYQFLTIRVNKKVNRMVGKEDEQTGEFTYVPAKDSLVSISLYSFVAALNNASDANIRRLSTKVGRLIALERSDMLNDIFNGGTFDLIQDPVKKGQKYVNPFSAEHEETEISHDTWYNYITSIKLDDEGMNQLSASRAKAFEI